MALTRPRAYQIYDIDYKQATRVVTTTNITLAGSAPNTVDGISLAANDRILVTGQTAGSENGIYYVATLGTGSNGTWTRSVDTNATGELLSGTIVMVTEGNVYKDTQWKLTTDDPITIGSTALTFVQNYSANSISSGTSNVVVTSNGAVTISSAGTSNVLTVNSNSVSIAGNIYPTANVTYGIGNSTNRFKDIWLSNSTIYLGNVALSADSTTLLVNGTNVVTSTNGIISTTGNVTGGNLIATGTVSASGNITGSYIIGDGSQLTGLPASYSNANVASYLASGSDTSNITTTANITGGNILTSGIISATGNITSPYFIGNGSQLTGVTSYANSNVAAYLASGTDSSNIVTTANVSGANLVTSNGVYSKDVSATGNVYVNGFVSVVGNLYVANVVATSNLVVQDPLVYLTANSTYPYIYDIGLYSQFTGGVGNTYQHTGFVRDYADNTWKLFSNAPEPTGTTIDFANAIYDPLKSGAITSTGNVSATGNISGTYFIGNGSQLTGITAGSGATTTFSNTAPVTAKAGDVWIQANTAVQYVYFDDGTSNQWAEMEAYQSYSSTITSNSVHVDSFTGDGATLTFALGVTPSSADDVTVNYNGATLLHNSYTVSGANITFGSAPASGYQFDVMTLIPGPAATLSAAGSNTQIQFNNSGSFGASANLTFNTATNTLATGNISANGNITQNGAAVATTGKAIAMAIVFGF